MALSVLSVGGSIIAPDKINSEFLRGFLKEVRKYLQEYPEDKLIFVCGGGAPARLYQTAYREVLDGEEQDLGAQDWLGIKATHMNAQIVKAIFGNLCEDEVVTNPTSDNILFSGRILVAGGWKPGFSTDTDAVYLARRFGATKIINLSNISKVYTDDPRKNPDAKPIDTISWEDFRLMVGDEWVPGKNAPFDPIASKLAQESKIKVICSDGRNIENTMAILKGESFTGTVIG
ncbi:MAG: UMP kinase [Sphaerochaetaceae bacterium]|nr:UMP kinase [Sphaerochaetaceae bacterium]